MQTGVGVQIVRAIPFIKKLRCTAVHYQLLLNRFLYVSSKGKREFLHKWTTESGLVRESMMSLQYLMSE